PARRLCLFIGAIWTCALGSLSVTPQLTELSLPQGARKRLKFTVVNEDPLSTRTIRYYPVSFYQNEDGAYALAPESVSPYSCHEWFRLDTAELMLGPGEGKEVFVELVVPSGARGTRFGAVAFEMLPVPVPGAWASAGLVIRMPAFVEVTITGTRGRKSIEVTDIKVEPARAVQRQLPVEVKEDALAVVVSVRNTGEVSLPVRGRLLFRDEYRRRYRELPLGAGGALLPGAKTRLISVTPRVKPGNYVVEASLNIGGVSPAKASVPVEITSTTSRTAGALSSAPVLDLTVSTEKIELTAPARSTRTNYVVFRNESNKEQVLTAEVTYLASDGSGRVIESDNPGRHADCRDWITFEKNMVRIAPHSSEAVRLTIKVPDTTPGGRYACLYFEDSAAVPQDKKGPRASVSIPVFLTVTGNYPRRVEIARVNTSKTPLGVQVSLANTGAVHVRPKGRVLVRQAIVPGASSDDSYKSLGSFTLDDDVLVLPGDTVVLAGTYQGDVRKGHYRLDVNIECGAGLSLFKSEEVIVR
ncbi:MAG: hypothetical protein ABIK86_06000, partial [candidate division WOR-3 bacterium]